jgi:hypothetical protein
MEFDHQSFKNLPILGAAPAQDRTQIPKKQPARREQTV